MADVTLDASGDVDTDALIDVGVEYGSSAPGIKAIAGDVAAGAAVGAALGTAVPVLGNVAGAIVGTIAGLVLGIAPYIQNALKGQCTITIHGLDTDCSDYPRNVQVAAQWLKDNPQAALTLDPETFADQATILVPNFLEWFATTSSDYQDRMRSSPAWPALQKLPGAQTLLRSIQVPAASALAAATPELLPVYVGTFPQTFPALLSSDLDKIVQKVTPLLNGKINAAADWIRAQPVYPTQEQAHAHFPALTPDEIAQALHMAPETEAQNTAAFLGTVAHTQGGKLGRKVVPVLHGFGSTTAAKRAAASVPRVLGPKVAHPRVTMSTSGGTGETNAVIAVGAVALAALLFLRR